MAAYSVATAKHATLVANTVDTVTLTNPVKRILIKNRSTSGTIYATMSATAPTVAGDNTIAIAGGETYESPPERAWSQAIDPVVSLISSAADAYTVMAEG